MRSAIGWWLLLGALAGCPSSSTSTRATTTAPRYEQSSGWQPPSAARPQYDAARSGAASLQPDAALAQVAEDIAMRVLADAQGRPPSARVVQALAWQRGVTDPVPTVLAYRGTGWSAPPDIGSEIAALVRSDGLTHVGIARRMEGSQEALVAVLVSRRIRLEPIATQVSTGSRLVVRGALLGGLNTPVLSVTRPDGHTEETPLGQGPDFFGQFPLNARGHWQVEINAESPSGATVVANFPVYVDTAPPATPEEHSGGGTEDPTAVEQSLLEQLNASRRAAGLRPLEAHPLVTTVARAHVTEMATRHYVAHNSLDGTTPGERLRRAGLQSGLSLENVARGYSAREIHDGLMASPGHRANILNSRVTHVGIAVVREEGAGGALVMSEDFIEVAAAIDTAASLQTLLEGIRRNRVARGQTAYTVNATLATAAQEAASAFFADPRRTQQEVLDGVAQRLQRESLQFRRIAVAAAFGPRLEGADRLEPLFDRDMRLLGVGLAQGSRPDAPPNAVFVVYVMAVPR